MFVVVCLFFSLNMLISISKQNIAGECGCFWQKIPPATQAPEKYMKHNSISPVSGFSGQLFGTKIEYSNQNLKNKSMSPS